MIDTWHYKPSLRGGLVYYGRSIVKRAVSWDVRIGPGPIPYGLCGIERGVWQDILRLTLFTQSTPLQVFGLVVKDVGGLSLSKNFSYSANIHG